jgi:hypothetical protein
VPWAYRTRDFIKDADGAFRWLVDSGYRRVEEDDRPNRYANVVYAGAEFYVRVGWETRDNYVSVDFGPVIDGVVPPAWPDRINGRRVRYPLWLLVWVMTGDEVLARSLGQKVGSRASLRQTLEQFAGLLREHGLAIIAGDLAILPLLDTADAQRIAANVEDKPWGQPPASVAD